MYWLFIHIHLANAFSPDLLQDARQNPEEAASACLYRNFSLVHGCYKQLWPNCGLQILLFRSNQVWRGSRVSSSRLACNQTASVPLWLWSHFPFVTTVTYIFLWNVCYLSSTFHPTQPGQEKAEQPVSVIAGWPPFRASTCLWSATNRHSRSWVKLNHYLFSATYPLVWVCGL